MKKIQILIYLYYLLMNSGVDELSGYMHSLRGIIYNTPMDEDVADYPSMNSIDDLKKQLQNKYGRLFR